MGGPAKYVQRHFEHVTDPRADRGCNHDLLEMVFVALTAAICGANGWADVERFAKAKLDWFRQYIELPHGVPSHDTFGRVFARLDTGEFLSAMHQWVDQFAGSLRSRGIAIDGKTLRGSFDQAAGQSPLHTTHHGLCHRHAARAAADVGRREVERDSRRAGAAATLGTGGSGGHAGRHARSNQDGKGHC
ncbi:MAG: ISAs1 family transposase [Planctomycetaceae bacterium]